MIGENDLVSSGASNGTCCALSKDEADSYIGDATFHEPSGVG